jgi:hypothetical protein
LTGLALAIVAAAIVMPVLAVIVGAAVASTVVVLAPAITVLSLIVVVIPSTIAHIVVSSAIAAAVMDAVVLAVTAMLTGDGRRCGEDRAGEGECGDPSKLTYAVLHCSSSMCCGLTCDVRRLLVRVNAGVIRA